MGTCTDLTTQEAQQMPGHMVPMILATAPGSTRGTLLCGFQQPHLSLTPTGINREPVVTETLPLVQLLGAAHWGPDEAQQLRPCAQTCAEGHSSWGQVGDQDVTS